MALVFHTAATDTTEYTKSSSSISVGILLRNTSTRNSVTAVLPCWMYLTSDGKKRKCGRARLRLARSSEAPLPGFFTD